MRHNASGAHQEDAQRAARLRSNAQRGSRAHGEQLRRRLVALRHTARLRVGATQGLRVSAARKHSFEQTRRCQP